MASPQSIDSGTRAQPWVLKTPPGTSEFKMFRDETLDPPALVCMVGKTELRRGRRAEAGLAEVEHNPRNNRVRAI